MGATHEHRGPSTTKRSAPRSLRRLDLDIPTPASWWRCSGPRAAARPRCCASSPGWSARRGNVLFHGETPPTPMCASATSASCSSTTRCSAHDDLRERRLRAARAAEGRHAEPRPRSSEGDRAAGTGAARLDPGRPLSAPAVGRAAPAHRLARALAVEPQVLLLDEPFGALDAKVRKELRRWLRRLHDEVHVTSVFVTHDQEEAMEGGRPRGGDEPWPRRAGGAARRGVRPPGHPFVLQFLGDVNLFLDRGPQYAHRVQARGCGWLRRRRAVA